MNNSNSPFHGDFSEYIEFVKESCGLVEAAETLNALPAKEGSRYQGQCPLGHSSKGGKCFTIYPDTQSFYCFHCGASGDVIDLVAKVKGIEPGEAINWLCREFGLPIFRSRHLSPEQVKVMEEKAAKREILHSILTEAAHFYHSILKTEKEMFSYLKDHYGLSEEIIESHSLGYSLGDVLIAHLESKGYRIEDMVESGIVIETKQGPKEFFNHRLIFPYFKTGKAVYMIGRQTKNTPDQPWEKSKYKKLKVNDFIENKYFIGEDTIRGAKEIIVAEGITDALAAIQAGFPCLSPVTTRFREEDSPKLLKLTRNAETIYLVPDNETNEAGLKGALSTASALEADNRTVYIVTLPKLDGQDKMDLNEFMRDQGVEAFRSCLKNAKTASQLEVDRLSSMKLDPIRLINAMQPLIEKLASETETMAATHILYAKENLSLLDDQVSALKKEIKILRKASTPEESKKKGFHSEPSVYFKGLVDVVLDDKGKIAFLLFENGNLVTKPSFQDQGKKLLPAPVDKLEWLLPKATDINRHYQNDTDDKLFGDLIEFFKTVSEMPSEDHYRFLAAWVMHTYLWDLFEYSPILLFYAVAERGKTRTGKALMYTAWRGVHLITLREAHIIRIAENCKSTIFVDVTDFWKSVQKNGSEDIFLSRFENGIKVPRVLYPEKGAFEDTVYHDLYGPTVIATNEPLNHIMESRAIEIIMPESVRRFENDIKPNMGLPYRERLVAFRARWLTQPLPDVKKPVGGRLGDITKPIRQIVNIVGRDEAWFLGFAKEFENRRKEESSETVECKVFRAIVNSRNRVSDNHLLHDDILETLNQNVNEKYQMGPVTIGKVTKRLGFQKYSSGTKRGIIWDESLIERLCGRYGFEYEPEMIMQTF